MNFNFNHLYYFYVIARSGGVTKAAKLLRIAQPSLSMQLKALEQSLDVLLFEKVGRNLVLTPMGERVFEYCRDIFDSAEELSDFIARTKKAGIQRCRFGVSSEIDRTFVADILGKVIRESKGQEKTSMSMVTFEKKELLNRLVSGDIDVMVTNRPVQNPHTLVLARISMPVVLVGSSKLVPQFGKGSKLTLAQLLKTRELGLVLPTENQQLRLEADLFIQKSRISAPGIFESDMLSVLIRAILEGVGVGFIPRNFIEKEISQGKLTVFPGPALWTSQLFVVTRKRKSADPVIEKIRKAFPVKT